MKKSLCHSLSLFCLLELNVLQAVADEQARLAVGLHLDTQLGERLTDGRRNPLAESPVLLVVGDADEAIAAGNLNLLVAEKGVEDLAIIVTKHVRLLVLILLGVVHHAKLSVEGEFGSTRHLHRIVLNAAQLAVNSITLQSRVSAEVLEPIKALLQVGRSGLERLEAGVAHLVIRGELGELRVHVEALLDLLDIVGIGSSGDRRLNLRLDRVIRAGLATQRPAGRESGLPVSERGEELPRGLTVAVTRARRIEGSAAHDLLLHLHNAVFEDDGPAAVVVVLLPAEHGVHGVSLLRSRSGLSCCGTHNALVTDKNLPVCEGHDITAEHGLAAKRLGRNPVVTEHDNLLQVLAKAARQDSAKSVRHLRVS